MTTTELIALVAKDTEEACKLIVQCGYQGGVKKSVADKVSLIWAEWRREALSW